MGAICCESGAWEWQSSKGMREQRGKTALGSVLCQENLHHHTSCPLSISCQACAGTRGCMAQNCGINCSEGHQRWHRKAHSQDPPSQGTHGAWGAHSTQVEAEIDASSEGMCCLLLAVTAGFPISSDACS